MEQIKGPRVESPGRGTKNQAKHGGLKHKARAWGEGPSGPTLSRRSLATLGVRL